MNAILSLGGWSIIPDLATQYLLKFIYQTPLIHRAVGILPATPNTPQFRRHYGVTFAFVVLGYLLYTLVDKAVYAQPNFYEILGVPYTVDENGLKLAFRQFAKRNHPDRPGVGKQGEELFMHVRDVFDALKDPAVRFAYDRFGPDALKWRTQCSTASEFLWHGLSSSSGYHISAAVFLLFWSALGRPTPFTFWRYILFFSLLVAELVLIISPSPSPSNRHVTLLHKTFPNRIAYQHVLFLHQIFMFLNVALLRVTPYLLPIDEFADPKLEQALLDRTAALVSVADREASKMVHTELQSITHDPTAANPSPSTFPSYPGFGPTPHQPSYARMEPVPASTAMQLLTEIAPEMEALIIETNIKQDAGPLKTAWEAAVARAHTRMVEEAQLELEKEVENAREERSQNSKGRGMAHSSRETTPTPQSPRTLPGTPNPTRVKSEDQDEGYAGFGESSYFMVSPSRGMTRSLKSVPRTPGELPSPRPSPSPPPTLTPKRGQAVVFGEHALNHVSGFRAFTMSPRGNSGTSPAGYFAKGTAAVDEHVSERIRARSVSC